MSRRSSLYKLDADKLEWKFLYQDESVLDTKDIETKCKQVNVTSRDGSKVPMFVSYKKGIKLDGNNPATIYGYGGFNIGINVSYLGPVRHADQSRRGRCPARLAWR